MTVVLAALTEDGVVIASDSQISEGGWSKLNGYPDKIWTERELGYAFGSAGSIRVAQVVRFAGEWPKYREDEHDLPKFAVLEFVPVLKATLEQHGLLREKNGIHTMDAEFIVAWRDNFFAIGDDFSIMMPVDGRIAIGSGYAESYGALGDHGMWTPDEVIEAVRRSTLTAQGVGGDIYYTNTIDLIIERVENV